LSKKKGEGQGESGNQKDASPTLITESEFSANQQIKRIR
jgi:hypothetical protein